MWERQGSAKDGRWIHLPSFPLSVFPSMLKGLGDPSSRCAWADDVNCRDQLRKLPGEGGTQQGAPGWGGKKGVIGIPFYSTTAVIAQLYCLEWSWFCFTLVRVPFFYYSDIKVGLFRKKGTVVFVSRSGFRGSVASAVPRQFVCALFGKPCSRGFVVIPKGWEGRFIISEVRAHAVCGQQRDSAQWESTNNGCSLHLDTSTHKSSLVHYINCTHACVLYMSTKSNQERKGGWKQEMLREREGEREGGQGKRGQSHMFCLFCFIWPHTGLEFSYF